MLYYLLCKLKHLLLGLGAIFSKIFCCFKRRRRNSDNLIPVNVAKTASNFINDVAGATNWDDDDWDNCEIVIDAKPRTTSDHIAAYRQQIAVRQNSAPEESVEPEVDLFADMIPDIKRQRKVFVGGTSQAGAVEGQSRLAVVSDEVLVPGTGQSELANWDEDSNNLQGWDCQEEELTDALRSHRRSRR